MPPPTMLQQPSPLEHDLFISYRRASNAASAASVAHGKWVDAFCEGLRNNLDEMRGTVSIWRDADELRAGDFWRPELVAALDKSAIFLALVSGSYFASDECRKELDHFMGRMKAEHNARRKMRACKSVGGCEPRGLASSR